MPNLGRRIEDLEILSGIVDEDIVLVLDYQSEGNYTTKRASITTFIQSISGVSSSTFEEFEVTVYQDINYLSGEIDSNSTNITNNDNDIIYLSGEIDSNSSNITNNDLDIDYLSGEIDSNSTNISNNDNDIIYLSGEIDSNSTNISNLSNTYVTLATAQSITATKTFNDVNIEGTLWATSAVFITTETMTLSSNWIELNNNETGIPTEDAGISINRGTYPDALLKWDESLSGWMYGVSGNLLEIGSGADINYLSGEIDNNSAEISSNDADITYISGQVTGGVSLDTVNEYTAQQVVSMVTLDASADITWDLDIAQTAEIYLSGDIALSGINMLAGGTYILKVTQNSGGSHELSGFGSEFKFPGGTSPTFTAADGSVDIITVLSDGTNMYSVISNDLK